MSRGVYSTLGQSSISTSHTPNSSASASSPSSNPAFKELKTGRARSEAEELYAKFDMSFSRRIEARMTRSHTTASGTQLPYQHHHDGKHVHARDLLASPTSSTRSLPVLSVSAPVVRKREVSILKPGAEGRLLVPDVKLKRTDLSVAAMSTGVTGQEGQECGEEYPPIDLQRRGSSISVSDVDSESMSRASISVAVPQHRRRECLAILCM